MSEENGVREVTLELIPIFGDEENICDHCIFDGYCPDSCELQCKSGFVWQIKEKRVRVTI